VAVVLRVIFYISWKNLIGDQVNLSGLPEINLAPSVNPESYLYTSLTSFSQNNQRLKSLQAAIVNYFYFAILITMSLIYNIN
jgi:hypothetical protein